MKIDLLRVGSLVNLNRVSSLNLSNPANFQSAGVSLKMREQLDSKIWKFHNILKTKLENQLEWNPTDLWYPPNTDFYHSTSVVGAG
jgi:hypothetical protein